MKISRLSLIILLSVLLMFIRLGGTSVFQVAEARNSECAREMMLSSDKIIPTFNGQLRTDKPALEYYAMMAAYKLFGVNEGSARFFSAICGVLVVVCTFLFVNKNVNEKAAWWSSLILLSSIHTIVQFRLATPDPYLIFCHVLSIYCFWEGFTGRRFSWYALMYFLLGSGFFAKGPVGIALPALTIFLYLLFTKQFTWKNIVSLQPWTGILITAIVAFPWYYLVHTHTNGDWTKGFFLEHNVGRFDEPVDNHGGPFIITFLFVIMGMFPFSAFFIRAGKYVWQNRKTNHFLLFSFIAFWCVVGFYFFSSTRLLNYTTPAYPFLAIMIGCWLSERLPFFSFQKIKPELLIISVLTILTPVGIYVWAINTEPINNVSWIAFPLLILPAGVFIALRYRKNIAFTMQAIGFTYMLSSLVIFIWLFPAMDSYTAMKKHKPVISKANNIIAYQSFNDAFVFYAKKNIPVFTKIDSLTQFVNTHDNVLILGNGKKFPQLDSLSSLQLYSKDRDLFSSKYSVIYRKK